MAKVRVKIFNGSKVGTVQDFEVTPHKKTKKINHKRAKNELRKLQCDGKLKHTSMTSANEYLYASTDDMEVYTCEFCGGFHLGHSKSSKQKLKK